jgi:predicted DNA-binding transcriptional regulator AlpA
MTTPEQIVNGYGTFLLRFEDLADRRICTDRATLRRWMNRPPDKNPFPKPIRTGRFLAWKLESVERWLEAEQITA